MKLMHVIDPSRHEITRMMLVALYDAKAPVRITTTGQWKLPLGPQPDVDQARPSTCRRGVLRNLNLQLPREIPTRCHNYFPVGGGIDWHTDSGDHGWRLYVFRAGPGSSTFYYRDQKFEEPSEGAYVFRIEENAWHAVECNRERWSCGVLLTEGWKDEIVSACST